MPIGIGSGGNTILIDGDNGGTGRIIQSSDFNVNRSVYWGPLKRGIRTFKQVSFTNASTVVINNITGEHNNYMLMFRYLTASYLGTYINMQFSKDNGTTWITTGYNYRDGVTNYTNSNKISFAYVSSNGVSPEFAVWNFTPYPFTLSNFSSGINNLTFGYNTDAYSIGGYLANGTGVNALRIYSDSVGTITGKVYLMGT